jgi:hypothetical protein
MSIVPLNVALEGWLSDPLGISTLGWISEVEIEIVVPPKVEISRPGGGGGGPRTYYFPDAAVTISVRFEGRLLSEQSFKIDQQEIPNIVAKVIKFNAKVVKINIIYQEIKRVEVVRYERSS